MRTFKRGRGAAPSILSYSSHARSIVKHDLMVTPRVDHKQKADHTETEQSGSPSVEAAVIIGLVALSIARRDQPRVVGPRILPEGWRVADAAHESTMANP